VAVTYPLVGVLMVTVTDHVPLAPTVAVAPLTPAGPDRQTVSPLGHSSPTVPLKVHVFPGPWTAMTVTVGAWLVRVV
jgi:hypothetical protein